jgi:1,4-alpha-glucan branching enzyme
VLTKNWNSKTGRFDVTFDLPADLDIGQAAVVGEFNDWSETANPMSTDRDGRWTATIALEPNRTYRFRYHLGEDRWENDWNADRYVGNDFGGADSVVVVPEEPSAPPPAKAVAPREAATKKAAAKKAPAKKKAAKKKAAAKKAAAKKAAKKATPPREG